jgi:hypothetical protein
LLFIIYNILYLTGCTRLAAACDKVYQLLGHVRWFSLGTPASSTTETGHHDIAGIVVEEAGVPREPNIFKIGHLANLRGQEM